MGKATASASSAGGIAARASAEARLASRGFPLAASLSEVSLEETPGGGQAVVARSTDGKGRCRVLAPYPGATTMTSFPAPEDILPGGIVLGVSSGEETSRLDVVLGALQCSRFLCCARNKIYWTTPEWGTSASDLPPETQFVLAELRRSGPPCSSAPRYAVLVPLIDGGRFRATLRPPQADPSTAVGGGGSKKAPAVKSDKLCLRVESGSPLVKSSKFEGVLLVAAGSGDPLSLADAAVVAAASLSGAATARTTKRVPEFVDLFGWCTWDAFYSSVSARGVSDGLASLAASGAPPPRFLIIDDGWQVTSLDGPLLKTHHAASSEADAARADAELDALMRRAESSGLLGPMANAAAAEEVVEREVREAAAEKEQLSFFGGDESVLATNPDLKHRAALAHLAEEKATAPGPPPAPTVFPAPRPSRARRALAAASGWAKGQAEVALASIYGRLVERAPAGSAGIRVFARLVANADPGGWNAKAKREEKEEARTEATPTPAGARKASPPAAEPKDGPLRPALLNFYASTSDHVRRLASFRANAKFGRPGAGPAEPMAPGPKDGLALVVADVRERFGVRQVLAWHALHGYWGGVSPEASGFFADEDDRDKTRHSECSPALVWPVPTPGNLDVDPPYEWSPQCLSGVGLARDPDALFRNLHGYLRDSGVDGVKVDAQATLGMIGGGAVPAPVAGLETAEGGGGDEATPLAVVGGPSLSSLYHSALERSIAEHFPGNAAINCMCHSTEDVFNFSGSAVARTSDDFWPRDPASHRAHVAVNAFNSVFFSPLVQPDWDMFHSRHPAARLHAIARVVSGGPVYVSDAPGCHDAELLKKLALPDGRVLRPAVPGRPTEDCLFLDVMRDGESLLKVTTVNGTVVRDDGGEEEGEDEREERRRREDVGVGVDFFRSSDDGGVAAVVESGGEEPRRRNNDAGDFDYSCGVVGVFNTQGAAWSRRTRRFELLKTARKPRDDKSDDEEEREERDDEASSAADVGCSPSGVASWLKGKLLPLCGRDAGDERDGETLTTTVRPGDVVPRLRAPSSGLFVAWSDSTRTATLVRAGAPSDGDGDASADGAGDEKGKPVPNKNSVGDSITVSLPRGGADLVTFSPVLLLLEGKSAATLLRASVVGLSPFFNAGGALVSVSAVRGPTRSIKIALRGHGRVVIWCEHRPKAALVDGRRIEREDEGLSWDEGTGLASVEVLPREIEVEVSGEGGGEARAGFEPDAEVVVHW